MATKVKSPFVSTDDDDLFVIDTVSKIKAVIYDGGEGENTIRIVNDLNLAPIDSFANIQHFEVAAGKKVVVTAAQIQQIADDAADAGTNWDFTGLGEKAALNIKLKAAESLDLSSDLNNDSPFANLDVVVSGSKGADDFSGSESTEKVTGAGGDDELSTNGGNDTVDGGVGDDTIDGGDGDDSLLGGAGDDIISGGDGNDTINGGGGDDVIDAGDGDDTIIVGVGDDELNGGSGSDTFVINTRFVDGDVVIDGGTNDLDSLGRAGQVIPVDIDGNPIPDSSYLVGQSYITDGVVTPVFYTGTSISTVSSTLAYNAADTLLFNKSGNFSNIEFSHIENIQLGSGVSVTFSSSQLDDAGESLDLGAMNPGLQFYGVAGGKSESVTVRVDYAENTFTNSTVTGFAGTSYLQGDFQLDDASIGDLFHNVLHKDDFKTNSISKANDTLHGSLGSYGRADGSNSNDYGQGGEGVDNATLRLGDDVFFGNGGNDLLVGHQGKDYLDGGDGDDIFTITGFQTGVFGSSGKADDGNAEWIAGDVIVGGVGTDTLRITSGALDTNKGLVTLTDTNFKSMEVVQVGTTVGRLNVEDSALQLLNDHYYLKAGTTESTGTGLKSGQSFDNVIIDASGVTANGLKFEGNGNANTFKGTSKADTFIGNSGNDTLTGNGGADIFQFGNVHTQTVTGGSTTIQTYTNVGSALTGIDTITDFTSGTDKIHLDNDFFSAFSSTGAINAGNLVKGVGVIAAVDADDYLIYDTTSKALYYDADGSGGGLAVQIAILTGVTNLVDTDFLII